MRYLLWIRGKECERGRHHREMEAGKVCAAGGQVWGVIGHGCVQAAWREECGGSGQGAGVCRVIKVWGIAKEIQFGYLPGDLNSKYI